MRLRHQDGRVWRKPTWGGQFIGPTASTAKSTSPPPKKLILWIVPSDRDNAERQLQDLHMVESKSNEAINRIWQSDLLGRRSDAEIIRRLTQARIAERLTAGSVPACYVINVDGEWGCGKSFFLDRFGKHLAEEGHIVASINAWENDHLSDPLLTVISAIDKVLAPTLKLGKIQKLWQAAKIAGAKTIIIGGKHLALAGVRMATSFSAGQIEALTGELSAAARTQMTQAGEKTADKILDPAADNLIKELEKAQSSVKQFRDGLRSALADEDGKILYILVDELDRCRPTYAIELLERVKHLFSVDRVAFIFATNTAQLTCSIGAIYGEKFDGIRYLNRFFDRTYRFPDAEYLPLVQSLFEQKSIQASKLSSPGALNPAEFFVLAMDHMGLQPRDAEQCIEILSDVVSLWKESIELELVYLLPLIMSIQQGNNAALIESLKSLSGTDILRAMPKRRSFRGVKFRRWREDSFRQTEDQPEEVIFPELVNAFVTVFSGSFRDYNRRRESGGAKEWIHDRFEREFKARFPGGYRSDDPLLSVVRRYPELVRAAGRFHGQTK